MLRQTIQQIKNNIFVLYSEILLHLTVFYSGSLKIVPARMVVRDYFIPYIPNDCLLDQYASD